MIEDFRMLKISKKKCDFNIEMYSTREVPKMFPTVTALLC